MYYDGILKFNQIYIPGTHDSCTFNVRKLMLYKLIIYNVIISKI